MTAAELFRNIWDAFTQGRMNDLAPALHPEIEWRPSLGGEVLRGPDDLERWLERERRTWQSVVVVYEDMREVADDCVIAFGRVTAFGYGGEQAIDTDVAWVLEFRDDLLLRAAAFADRGDALRYIASRREAIV